MTINTSSNQQESQLARSPAATNSSSPPIDNNQKQNSGSNGSKKKAPLVLSLNKETTQSTPKRQNAYSAPVVASTLDEIERLRARMQTLGTGSTAFLIISVILGAFAFLLGIDASSPATFELPNEIVGQLFVESSVGGVDPFATIFTQTVDMMSSPLFKIIGGGFVLMGIINGIARQSLHALFIGITAGMVLLQTPTIMEVIMQENSVPNRTEKVLAEGQPPYVVAQSMIKAGNIAAARNAVDALIDVSYQGVNDIDAAIVTALEMAVYESPKSTIAISTVKEAGESDASKGRIAEVLGIIATILLLSAVVAFSLRKSILANVTSIENDLAFVYPIQQ